MLQSPKHDRRTGCPETGGRCDPYGFFIPDMDRDRMVAINARRAVAELLALAGLVVFVVSIVALGTMADRTHDRPMAVVAEHAR